MSTTAELDRSMQQATYMLGRLVERVHMFTEQHHTCDQRHFRHPWPPQKDCPGCQCEIDKWVRRLHLEMPYRLFGWDAVVDAAERAIQIKIDQAEANRNKGAYI